MMLEPFTYEDQPQTRSSDALIQAIDRIKELEQKITNLLIETDKRVEKYREALVKIKRETTDGFTYKLVCEVLEKDND